MMDAISDARVTRVVFMTSAQVGKTEAILNALGYFIDIDPCPMLVVQPTIEMAEAFSKDRLATMIRDSSVITKKIADPKSRDSSNSLLHKKYSGGHVTLAGANAPSGLASRPIRVVLLDEVDRYPSSAGTEGDPANLAIKRTTTFWNKKIIMVSTPGLKGASRIEAAFEDGDQRRYHVPCPHCGHKQILRWPNLKWENGNPDSAAYLCESCDELIPESKKMFMLMRGHWIASAPFNGIASFHINELYSPWAPWAGIIRAFLEAKDNPELLKTWVNTSLGETFEPRSETTFTWGDLYRRREIYPTGTAPERALMLTAAVDVQADRLEFKVVGHNRREKWVVDHIVLPGDTQGDEVWRELDELIEREWPHANGGMMPLKMVLVDSGFRTNRVYEYTREKPKNRVLAIKGMDTLDTPTGIPKLQDVNLRSRKRIPRGVSVLPVGVRVIKQELFAHLSIEPPTDEEVKRSGYPKSFIHFPEFSEEYFKQLTAERMMKVKDRRGFFRFEYVKTYERNEALDLMVYNYAAAHALGTHRWSEEKWRSLEVTLGVKPVKLEAPPEDESEAEAPKENKEAPRSKVKPKVKVRQRASGFW
jgi:phage terminase large subunit GpA-like protein